METSLKYNDNFRFRFKKKLCSEPSIHLVERTFIISFFLSGQDFYTNKKKFSLTLLKNLKIKPTCIFGSLFSLSGLSACNPIDYLDRIEVRR